MKLKEIKGQYRQNKIMKSDYIQKMYQIHECLFDYSDLLNEGNISAIHIQRNGVVVGFIHPPIQMWCEHGDIRTAPIEALNFGSYEGEEFRMLEKIIKSLDVNSPVFFDIGANAGFYTLGLSASSSNIRSYCFEPIPKTFELLKRNLELNNLTQAKTFNFALSNRNGESKFYSYPSQSGASSAAKLLDSNDAYEVTCQLKKLDVIANTLPKVDLIKCDVEGGELHVFEGAINTLEVCKPVIFTEMLRKWCNKFSYHPNTIIELLQKIGYLCHRIKDLKIEDCSEITSETIETNFIFLHKEKHEYLKRILQ